MAVQPWRPGTSGPVPEEREAPLFADRQLGMGGFPAAVLGERQQFGQVECLRDLLQVQVRQWRRGFADGKARTAFFDQGYRKALAAQDQRQQRAAEAGAQDGHVAALVHGAVQFRQRRAASQVCVWFMRSKRSCWSRAQSGHG